MSNILFRCYIKNRRKKSVFFLRFFINTMSVSLKFKLTIKDLIFFKLYKINKGSFLKKILDINQLSVRVIISYLIGHAPLAHDSSPISSSTSSFSYFEIREGMK